MDMTNTRINLTQHAATPDQGCFEPSDKTFVQRLLTFDTLPKASVITERAGVLAAIAKYDCATEAMIGGAPFLMPSLERALIAVGILPVYAFSVRESVDQVQPDGSVRKTAVFKHVGFVPAV